MNFEDVKPCGSCGAPVRWLRNVASGKPAPINAEPSPDGNIQIGAQYRVVPRAELEDVRAHGEALYTNRFHARRRGHGSGWGDE